MKAYSSKDFYLSSYLIANGCNLIDNIVEDRVTTFVFENNVEVKKLIGNYYSLKSRVEPLGVWSGHTYFEVSDSRFKNKCKII